MFCFLRDYLCLVYRNLRKKLKGASWAQFFPDCKSVGKFSFHRNQDTEVPDIKCFRLANSNDARNVKFGHEWTRD